MSKQKILTMTEALTEAIGVIEGRLNRNPYAAVEDWKRALVFAHEPHVQRSGGKWAGACSCGWISAEKNTQGEAQQSASDHRDDIARRWKVAP